MPAAQGAEWANALAASNGGELLDYLEDHAARSTSRSTSGCTASPVSGRCCTAGRRPRCSAPRSDSAAHDADADPAPVRGERAPGWRCSIPTTTRSTATACSTPASTQTPFDPNAPAVRPAARRVDGGDSRDRRATPAITFNYNRPDNEPPQAMLLVTSASSSGDMAVGRPRRRARTRRSTWPRSARSSRHFSIRPSTRASCRRPSWRAPAYAITISTALAAANGVIDADRRRTQCLARCPVADIKASLAQAALFPTITTWNRLEARPRTPDVRTRAAGRGARRALDADQAVADGRVPRQRRRLAGVREAADADDAADEVPARRAAAVELFDSDDSARNQGRAPPGPARIGRADPLARPPARDGAPVARADRGAAGRLPARLHRRPTRSPRRIRSQAGDVDVCAHPEVWDTFQAFAGRAMDGGAFYEYLVADRGPSTPTTASPGSTPATI